MFDRTLVTSGFDTETLISEDYLTYILLAQIDAGRFLLRFDTTDPDSGLPLHIQVHPPTDYTRRYDPHPDAPPPPPAQAGSLTVRLLPDDEDAFLHLTVWVTVEDDSGRPPLFAPMGMLVNLELWKEGGEEEDGFERNHELRPSLVGLDEPTVAALRGAGIDPEAVEEDLREQVNQPIPLRLAQGQKVRRIRMRKFVTDEQRSLGVYVELALRSGPKPDAFVEPRGGDEADAQDFRPPGAPMVFATSPGLFALLGPDVKFHQAEPVESGDGFRYPLRKDPLDPESDEIGRIKGISVGPELNGGIPTDGGTPTGRLVIDVHGEYTEALGDPDFHLQLLFTFERDEDGFVSFDLDVDVDFGLLATLLLVAAGIGLTMLFAAWASPVIGGTIVGLAVLKELIAEPLAARVVEERLDEESAASLLDALPFRPPAAIRGWDPFYDTHVQIAGLLDEDVVVDEAGIAFQAARLALNKEPVPVRDVVVRDEGRTAGSVDALRYRICGFNRHSEAEDFDAVAPTTDRMEYTLAEPDGDRSLCLADTNDIPSLVSLTNAQIADRIGTKPKRLLAPITVTAERIHLVEGQIDQLLVLSRHERGEQRQHLINEFRREVFVLFVENFGVELREAVIADLTKALGEAPTEDQIRKEFNARINSLIDLMIPGFEAQVLPGLLNGAIARTLRFDLAPEELAAQQLAGVLILEGKEIVFRQNEDGTTTPYYRDHPDTDPEDNLLSLPQYTPPYQPPE
jgi:hypothetical protein